jgi:nucleoside-diphosphate-sugar epimerase
MLDERQLDELLTSPTEDLIRDLEALEGDIMVLGAGGKVGPTVCVMLQKACARCSKPRKVYAVARFTDPHVTELLAREHVTMLTADLNDPEQIAALPKVPNIIYMVGRKFGTSGNAHETWQMNTVIPAMVTRHFGDARYVVYSTGNVYPFTRPEEGGSVETDAADPVGEYGMSCLGRERVFEYAARHYGAKVLIFRLNYAIDLRYGVLFDLANRILAGEPVSLNVSGFNCVWQHYVAEVTIRSLLLADNKVEYLNVTGPEFVSTRWAACKLAEQLGKEVSFTGEPSEKALLSNAGKCVRLFGYPRKGVEELIALQAQWILSGGRQLGKPTHFEEQKGRF